MLKKVFLAAVLWVGATSAWASSFAGYVEVGVLEFKAEGQASFDGNPGNFFFSLPAPGAVTGFRLNPQPGDPVVIYDVQANDSGAFINNLTDGPSGLSANDPIAVMFSGTNSDEYPVSALYKSTSATGEFSAFSFFSVHIELTGSGDPTQTDVAATATFTAMAPIPLPAGMLLLLGGLGGLAVMRRVQRA